LSRCVSCAAGGRYADADAVRRQSVTINGSPWKSNCFLEWDVFESGGIVELELTDDITVGCGEGVDTLPPSLSTGGYN
jgi:hypothetical protein